MSSADLADFSLTAATVGTVFLGLALSGAALVIEGYGGAKSSAATAADELAVYTGVMLMGLSAHLRTWLEPGILDESHFAALVNAWGTAEPPDLNDRAPIEAANAFRTGVAELNQKRFDEGSLLSEGTAERERYRETMRDWNAASLPLLRRIAAAENRRNEVAPFEESARRLRSISDRIPLIAAGLVLEVGVSMAARISVAGIGEMPALNAAVAGGIGLFNAVLLWMGADNIRAVIRTLTS